MIFNINYIQLKDNGHNIQVASLNFQINVLKIKFFLYNKIYRQVTPVNTHKN